MWIFKERSNFPWAQNFRERSRMPHLTPVLCLQVGTNNFCFSTWTDTAAYCRAEAMGVILRVEDSTSVETKQNNLLKWLPGVPTDLVGGTSSLRVPCQAWEQVLKTEHNLYTVRPKHWQGLQGFTTVLIKNITQTSTKRNVLREVWVTQLSIKKESLGNRNTVSGRGG